MNGGVGLNYYCTWHIMGGAPEKLGRADIPQARDVLCDELLFGENGLAVTAYPGLRGGLLFMMDDGWEIPFSHGRDEGAWLKPYLGSCQMDPEKFPGYGDTPRERLKTLREKLEALGWKGLGIWISPTIAYGADVEGREARFTEYWRQRLEWSRYAGVAYWKADWGDYDISDRHKKILVALKEELYPALVFENAHVRPPMNLRGREGLFSLAAHRHRLGYSDVLRTYDVHIPLSIPTTLSRVAALLKYPPKMNPGRLGLINAEDEPYINAALGFAMGIMRYDPGQFCPAGTKEPMDAAFNGVRPLNYQLDEAARCVRWQAEFAPAFSISLGNSTISKEQGADAWFLTKDQTWLRFLQDKRIEQRAPLVIARNVAQPEIMSIEDISPYLLASRNPNGSLSLAALGRLTGEGKYVAPRACVRWEIGDLSGAIGIFGYFGSLELVFNRCLEGKGVFAKDLLEDKFTDITDEVEILGNALRLPGKVIEKIGLRGASAGDVSAPGMAFRIGEINDFVPVEVSPARPKRPPFYGLCLAQLRLAARVHTGKKKREHRRRLQ